MKQVIACCVLLVTQLMASDTTVVPKAEEDNQWEPRNLDAESFN